MFVHFMRTAFNTFMPNEISHRYQLEQFISVLRDVRWLTNPDVNFKRMHQLYIVTVHKNK